MWTTEFEYDPNEESESDYQVDPIETADESDSDEKALIYGFYSQLKAQKDHFSNMQNRYRALTSTWLLAAFVGIGFLLSRHKLDLPFNNLLAIMILSFCVAFGITLIWHLDIILYQKLWLGVVAEMASLERENLWLPRINLNILLVKRTPRYRFFQSFIYIGSNIIFLVIMGLAAAFYFASTPWIIGLITVIILCIVVAVPYFMLTKSSELEDITPDSFKPPK